MQGGSAVRARVRKKLRSPVWILVRCRKTSGLPRLRGILQRNVHGTREESQGLRTRTCGRRCPHFEGQVVFRPRGGMLCRPTGQLRSCQMCPECSRSVTKVNWPYIYSAEAEHHIFSAEADACQMCPECSRSVTKVNWP